MLKLWQRVTLLSFGRSLFLAGVFFVLGIPTAMAEVTSIGGVHDRQHPARTVKEWLSQGEAQNNQPDVVVQVTAVKANPTEQGVEVILQTTVGEQLQVVNRSAGNSYIADIPNAQLRLPNGEAFVFRSQKPVAGISEITVTNFDPNTIRVTVTGEAGVPIVELFDSPEEGLIFSIASAVASSPQGEQPQTQPTPERVEPGNETQADEPSVEEEEGIELLVTGEQEGGYSVPDASTATITDTPIRDIPQSIQVVPRQVLEDRNVQRELEALETVSGVVDSDTRNAGLSATVAIRGFDSRIRLRNGLRSVLGTTNSEDFASIGTIERVEVLKGPASVLYGALAPGGVINYVTRQPLSEPYYRVGFEVGNYGLYEPSIDLSGPLTENGSVLYRLIAAYQNGGNPLDETSIAEQIISVAPSIAFRLGDSTDLTFTYEYGRFDTSTALQPVLSDGSLIPVDVNPNYFAAEETENNRVSFILNHRFSESLQLRSAAAATFSNEDSESIRLLAH